MNKHTPPNATTPRPVASSVLFAVVRAWRAVMYGVKELGKFWNRPVCVWINETTGAKQVAPASDGIIFWRFVVIGRGKPLEGLYTFRLWRFGVMKKCHAEIHSMCSPSLFKFINEKMTVPLGDMDATSASVSTYLPTRDQPGDGSCGMINAADGSDASSVPNESFPLARICTHEPECDLSSSRVMADCIGSANV